MADEPSAMNVNLGDPYAVYITAYWLQSMSQVFYTAANNLASQVQAKITQWNGPSGTAFRNRLTDLCNQLNMCGATFYGGANAMDSYSQTLDNAKTQADTAANNYKSGQVTMETYQNTISNIEYNIQYGDNGNINTAIQIGSYLDMLPKTPGS